MCGTLSAASSRLWVVLGTPSARVSVYPGRLRWIYIRRGWNCAAERFGSPHHQGLQNPPCQVDSTITWDVDYPLWRRTSLATSGSNVVSGGENRIFRSFSAWVLVEGWKPCSHHRPIRSQKSRDYSYSLGRAPHRVASMSDSASRSLTLALTRRINCTVSPWLKPLFAMPSSTGRVSQLWFWTLEAKRRLLAITPYARAKSLF